MKFVLSLVALMMSFVAMASQVEILQFSTFDNSPNPYQAEAHYRNTCMMDAYQLETTVMVKTNDSDVKVRMSRLEFHPAGVFYCFVRFFPTQKTDFKKETLSFEQKNCRDKEEEISAEATALWTTSSNRVKLPNGVKGCQVQVVRAVAL